MLIRNRGMLLWLVLVATSCSLKGENIVSLIGECDNYPSPSNSPYVLPFEAGTTLEVSQGNCGAASHFGQSRFAYDIKMNIGTNIIAARGGTVIETREDIADGAGCPDSNLVKIQHDDNTVAIYAHLTQDGAMVSVDDVVSQGDVIALSGNSGCSTGPHLHFDVQDSSANDSDGVPVTFSNTFPDNAFGLQHNTSYSAL